MTARSIGFVGMSHLGIVSAVVAAKKGFAVVAYDPSVERIDALSAARLPISEPDLPEALRGNADRIRFTASPADLSSCDLVVLSQDVPTNDAGDSDIGSVESLFHAMVGAARSDAILVVLSQAPPGFCRSLSSAGRSLYYQVETLIFGQAVIRALQPERFIVGAADPTLPLPPAYADYLGVFDCPIMVMRYESAELAKISINCCLVSSLSTANTLAELCEAIGADWSEIVPALRSDRRIGLHAYLTPGLGFAGGNLERDLAAVLKMAAAHGTHADVVGAWIRGSLHRKNWPASILARELGRRIDGARIGLLGLAYKADTAFTTNSPALHLLSKISQASFVAHDPAVPADGRVNVVRVEEPMAACKRADAVAVMTPWTMYKSLDPKDIAAAMSGRLLLDPFGVFDTDACRAAGLNHFVLGRPNARDDESV